MTISEENISEGDLVGPTYHRRTDEQIKQLAMALYKNELFTSLHLRDQHLLQMVFIPLALMDAVQLRELEINKAYCFYAYYADTTPQGVNGYPIFFSFSYLNEEDTMRMRDKYEQIKKVLDNA